MESRTKLCSLALVTLALAACNSNPARQSPAAKADLETETLGDIFNVHSLGPVLLAGQPTEADIARLQARGVTTVITLRTEGEVTKFDEKAAVEEAGMEFIAIPFREPESLTDEVFAEVRQTLNGAEGSVLLHCGSASRVGAVVIPWRVLDHGLSFEEALEEAREVGSRTPEYEERARDYVSRMKARK